MDFTMIGLTIAICGLLLINLILEKRVQALERAVNAYGKEIGALTGEVDKWKV